MSERMDGFVSEQLICLMYVCAEASPFNDEKLIDYLLTKRPRYHALEITGILLYNKQTFVGVLEGPQDIVQQVYKNICSDSRYKDPSILLIEPISHRHFRDWTMGFKPNDWLMAEITPGFNPMMRYPKWSHEDMGVCSGQMFQFLRNFRTGIEQSCAAEG
ncbi:MAG: BLUF domain-containing protein [Anaerohalosphaeraceae bacterium]